MIIVNAYAKINILLNVVDRLDNGYHELEMITVPLDFSDRLTFKKNNSNTIILDSNNKEIPLNNQNLVYKVIDYMCNEFKLNKGISVYINKVIPIGGGLGGGSADAAATLRAMNDLFDLGFSLDDLAEIGLKFGADIPFCVYNRPAIVKGVGEKITFFNDYLDFKVLLVNPNVFMSTKEVFENVDLNNIYHPDIEEMIHSYNNYDLEKVKENIGNSLEKFVFEKSSRTKDVKEYLKDVMNIPTLMSGSGSTIFGIYDNEIDLEHINYFQKNNYFYVLTHTKND